MRSRIVAISLLRNEADIVEAFVRWNLRYVDAMLIVDHRSIDNAARILHALQAEGLPLELRRSHALAHDQSPLLTALMRDAVDRFDPDWIIPLDADEFIVTRKNAPLGTLLGDPREPATPSLPFLTYIPTPHDDPAERNVLRRIQHHSDREMDRHLKIAIPCILHATVQICHGNHAAMDVQSGIMAPHRDVAGIRLAHFPIRSAKQAMSKAFAGRIADLLRADRQTDDSYHWQRLFERCRSGKPLDSIEVQEWAMRYVRMDDSMPRTLLDEPLESLGHAMPELRYVEYAVPIDPHAVLREWVTEIGQQYAPVTPPADSASSTLAQWIEDIALKVASRKSTLTAA